MSISHYLLLFTITIQQINAIELAPPKVTNPPTWSWDTLGSMTFAHTGQSTAYTSKDLQLLSKFPIVQFDKKEMIADQPNVDAIDRFIYAAKAVRDAHTTSTVQILLYINGLIDFPSFQHLYNKTSANNSLLLRDESGKLLKIRGNNVFDVRQPAMRKIFVDAALYGMSSQQFNGVFIDRGNWCEKSDCKIQWSSSICQSMVVSQQKLLMDLTAVLGEGNITLSKITSGTFNVEKDWEVANAAMTSDTFCSHYCHNCNNSIDPANKWNHPIDSQNCADSMTKITEMSQRQQLTESHAMGPFEGTYSDAAREFTMAAFLIAAGNLSFYSYADWSHNCWELAGTKWWKEYDEKLGYPTSPANTLVSGKRWKYERHFSSGTSVYVDVATRVVKIDWGNSTSIL